MEGGSELNWSLLIYQVLWIGIVLMPIRIRIRLSSFADPDLKPSLHMLENQKFFLTSSQQFTFFKSSFRRRHRYRNCQYFRQYFEKFLKK